MTLVPLWAQLRPGMRFLHVVRDGRDIALSANQGPVAKFYSAVYGKASGKASGGGDDGPRSSTGKAARLWNDWNMQVSTFSTRAAQEGSMSYSVVHSEDLVSASLAVRFGAIRTLAVFVGSSLSQEDICCLAQERMEVCLLLLLMFWLCSYFDCPAHVYTPTHVLFRSPHFNNHPYILTHHHQFMGSHQRDLGKTRTSAKESISARYGKWRSQMRPGSAALVELNSLGK